MSFKKALLRISTWRRNETWTACLLFTTIFLIATWKLIIHAVRVPFDGIYIFYPLFSYAIESIRHGHLPLWDPFSNAGVPNHLDPQNFILNPLTYLLSLTNLRPLDAFNFYWLFYWWLGGIGILFLLKKASSTLGRVFAACAFTFSGFQIGHAQHTSYVYSASFLPWLFYFSELFWEKKNYRYSFLAAAVGMLSVLGGYPVLIASNCILLAAWMFYRAPKSEWGRVAVHLSIITVAMAIALSPTLASIMIEGPDFFKRAGIGRLTLADALSRRTAFTLPSFLTIFFPILNALCGPNLGTDWAMGNGYAGFLAFPLAIIWLRKRTQEHKSVFPFVATFAFFFILSTVESNGIIKTFYYYAFFPVQFMLYSAGFRLYWIFLAALATGLGFSAFEQSTKKRETACILIASIGIYSLISLVSNQFIKGAGYRFFTNHWPNMISALSLYELGAFAAAVTALLAANGTLPLRRLANHAPVLLLALLAIDARFQVLDSGRVSLAWDFNPSELALEPSQHYTRYVRQSYPEHIEDIYSTTGQHQLNGHLIQRDFLLGAYINMRTPSFETLMESKFSDVLLRGENFYWLSPSTSKINDERLSAADLFNKTLKDPIPVYLEDSNTVPQNRPSIAFGSYGKVQIKEYEIDSVRLAVDVPNAAADTFLASTERFSPSWQVSIDGHSFHPTVKNNFFFRGVYLSPGLHDVVFRYNPRYYLPLACISWACMVLLFVFGLKRETLF